MEKIKPHLLLIILGITDAYLISHPNIIGRLGIFVYHYDMLKTFPRALITVFLSLAVCLALVFVSELLVQKPWAKFIPWLGLIASLAILVQVFLKFSHGSYRLTGQSFKFGMHLLPVLMAYIFAQKLWQSKGDKSQDQR